MKNKKGYWTYERCFEFAKECTSSMDMRRKSSGAYDAARRNKWLKDYTWFVKKNHDRDDYLIYSYEDPKNKTVYVGLTFDLEGRHRDHKRQKSKNGKMVYDIVYKYFSPIGIPEPIVKMEGLNALDAQYYEDWYKMAYAKCGWNVLNKAKTGEGVSSLGYNIPIWTYEKCREEASKYTSKQEFRKANDSAYQKSVRNKWIDDFSFKDTHQVQCENSANAVSVVGYDKNGNCIGKWSSMQQAEIELNIHGIKSIFSNPNRYRCGKYYWFKYPISDEEAKIKIEEIKNKYKESFRKGSEKRRKKVA